MIFLFRIARLWKLCYNYVRLSRDYPTPEYKNVFLSFKTRLFDFFAFNVFSAKNSLMTMTLVANSQQKKERHTFRHPRAFVHFATLQWLRDVRKSLFSIAHVSQSRYISHLTYPSCYRLDVSGMNSRTPSYFPGFPPERDSRSKTWKGFAKCSLVRQIVADVSFVDSHSWILPLITRVSANSLRSIAR